MTNHDVIKKLIGKISPIGETNIDKDRLKNLKELTSLAESLIMDIEDMAFRNKDAHEHSIKEAVKHANKFLSKIRSVDY